MSRPYVRHPPILDSQEQLAPRGLKASSQIQTLLMYFRSVSQQYSHIVIALIYAHCIQINITYNIYIFHNIMWIIVLYEDTFLASNKTDVI